MATRNNFALLSSTTLGANSTNISFTNLESYRQFRLIGSAKTTSTSKARIHYRFNSSTGNYATFTLNYFAGSYTEFGSAASGQTTYANYGRFVEITDSSRPAQEYTTFILNCLNVSDTSTFPFVDGKSSLGVDGANSFQYSHGQNVSITSAVSSFQLFLSAGDFASGSKFYIYGVKPS